MGDASMSELLDRAKASLEGVTEGPWQVVGYGNIHTETVGEYPPIGKIYGGSNQQFIAAARQLVPELIAEVERLEKLQTNYFRCAEALTEWRGRAMKAESEAESVKYQLEDECESHRETITKRDHWKSLWQGAVEGSTKVIQERDEALRALDKVTESWKRLVEGGSDE